METLKLPVKELAVFLVDAHRHSYADASAKKVKATREGSEDYHFEKGALKYHDTYFGSRDFIGEEVVYKGEKPVWGMNYFGYVLSKDVSKEDVYAFLRTALMQDLQGNLSVRGPEQFSIGDWRYRLSAEGNLGNFTGTEEIFYSGSVVYLCRVHGGFIR